MELFALEKYVRNAEAAFERDEYPEGISLLQEALAIEPNYSKAHNHLGWAYLFKVNDIETAEKHLRYALSNGSVYGPAFIHMSHILFNKGKYGEFADLLNKALMHGGVERSFIYNELGRMFETKRQFRKAIANYKNALALSFDDTEIRTIKENIHRCRQKRWMLMF